MALTAGSRLGPYEILGLIGAGGMGEVYRAADTRLDRSVAIKVLPADISADPDRRARFEREARTIAQLSHSRICALYDVGEHNGSMFLVMEHLEGETLARRLEKGPLPVDQALTLAIEIADALSAAHRHGVTHRDLKPGNVMLTNAGVKLLDFGLAKLTRPREQTVAAEFVSVPTRTTPLTAEGVIVGTLHYMAPEQLDGREVDARTDIWALGLVMFEMLTGRRAFEGESSASLVAAILEHEPPSLDSVKPSLRAPLEHVIQLCLAKDPDARWQSARDIGRELQWIPQTFASGRHAVAERATVSRAASLAAILGVAIAAGVLAGRFSGRPNSEDNQIRRLVVQLPASDTLDVGSRPALALAPDGSLLVYAAVRDGASHLFVRGLDTFDARLLPGTLGGSGPFFSPDGQAVGFFAAGQLMKTALGAGIPVPLGQAPSARGAAWLLSDTILFSPAPGTGLWQVAAAGGSPRALTRLDLGQTERTHRWPEVLPTGKTAFIVVRAAQNPSFDETSIVTLSLASAKLGGVVAQGTQPRFARTGHLLFARSGALHAVLFDRVRLTTTGSSVVVLEGMMTDPSTGAAQYSLADDGTLAYVRGSEWVPKRAALWIDGGNERTPALDRMLTYATPRVSPDGRRIAVNIEGATDNVWVAEGGSQSLRRLTFEAGSHVAPVWTRDGTRIAFASNAFGSYNLFWKRADGSDRVERLTESAHLQFPGSWSPDGQFLAYTDTTPETGSDIWVLSIAGKRHATPVVRTRFNEHGPAFSHDGRWLAYCSNESGRDEVYVQPFPGPGEKHQVSADGGQEPVWSARGDTLFYRSGKRILSVAVSVGETFTSSSARVFSEGDFQPSPMGGVPSYDVSPDGQRVLIIQGSRQTAPSTIHVILNWFEELKSKVPPT